MKGAALSVLLLCLAGPWCAQAQPGPVVDDTRRARLLDHRPWAGLEQWLDDDARRKPDDVGRIDIEQIDVAMEVGPGRLPEEVRFEVRVRATERVEAVVLFLPFAEPTTVGAAGDAPFFFEPGLGELVIPLETPLAEGAVASLEVEALLRIQDYCENPVQCADDGPLLHLLGPGWYPLSPDFPLADRFVLTFDLGVDPDTAVASGAIDDRGRWVQRNGSYVGAIAVGPYRRFEAGGHEAYLPPGAGIAPDLVVSTIGRAMEVLEPLLGPSPYRSIKAVAIADGTPAAIGPQATMLLPLPIWELDELTARVVAHELAHQWFFNTVAIAEDDDAWLSEAFAEYAATVVSRVRTGDDAHRRDNAWGYLLSGGAGRAGEPAVQSVDALSAPDFLQIVYYKGSVVLHMLRDALGGAIFDRTLGEFVQAFTDRIATSAELQAFFEERTERDLGEFFDQWVRRGGYPHLQVRVEPARNDRAPLTVTIGQRGGGPPFQADLPVDVTLDDGSTERATVAIGDGGVQSVGSPRGQWMRIDADLRFLRIVEPDPVEDVNLSGVVDGMDLLDVIAGRGAETPSPFWNETLDPNGDGAVDRFDREAVKAAFGSGW